MTEEKVEQPNIPVFRMQKIYIKDLSFENPHAPQIFLPQGQEPKVDFNLQLGNKKLIMTITKSLSLLRRKSLTKKLTIQSCL